MYSTNLPDSTGEYPLDKMIRSGKPKKQQAAVLHPLGSSVHHVPPHSADAEAAVLGSIMLDRNALSKAIEILNANDFYLEQHRLIYNAMCAMFERSITIDEISLTEELRRYGQLDTVGGLYYITDLCARTPTAANIESYARIVQEYSLKRHLITATSEVAARCYDPASDALEEVDYAERLIFEIAERRLRRTYTPLSKLAKDTMQMIARLAERDKSAMSGVPTGYTQLDKMLGGFQNSDLIILAARPSMGKTAFALSLARNIAIEARVGVAVFSVEMAAIQLVIRLLSAEARVNAHSIRTGNIDDKSFASLAHHIGVLSEAPIYIDDSAALSVMELRAKCRRLKTEKNIGLILIDYLQLMHSPKAESREREISIISRSLKQLAKELDVPIIALSQLNRSVEGRSDKRPMLSDLRESGSIEQDADVVMFINRPEYYDITTYEDGSSTEGTAEIIIGKQRNGPVGTVRLAFLNDFARFENLEFFREEPPDFSGSSADAFDVEPF